jgi:hypothetical protein
MLHPKDEYFLAMLRQRELLAFRPARSAIALARANRIRAPRPQQAL